MATMQETADKANRTASILAYSRSILAEEEAAGLVLDHETFDVTKHDGMVTIHNPATGNHRTFRIKTQGPDAKFMPGKRIVSLLTGPEREDFRDWTGFAFADDFGVKVWGSKKGGQFDVFANMLENPKKWAAKGCEYMMAVRCRRCSRVLSHPESISTGIGPTCREKE